MTRLSVNLNKVALLRNSRGHNQPDLLRYARLALDAGAGGLTLHPRADARHARLDDVLALARLPGLAAGDWELNVEGDLRPELVSLVGNAMVSQFTVVPVIPGELTSSRGWRAYDDHSLLRQVVEQLRASANRPRISVFCDPDPESVRLAQACAVDAVELYTGLYASAGSEEQRRLHFADLQAAASCARELGLKVNAGHDLDLNNLPTIIERLQPDEVSIGHALSCDALELGFEVAVRRYAQAVRN